MITESRARRFERKQLWIDVRFVQGAGWFVWVSTTFERGTGAICAYTRAEAIHEAIERWKNFRVYRRALGRQKRVL